MNIVITGGGGFIGRHLVQDQIIRGHRVKVIDLNLSGLSRWLTHPQLELIQGDIRNQELVEKVVANSDVVFHLASAHLSLTSSEREYWETNVNATKALVQFCKAAGVKRFIHCSSVGVYGEITDPLASEASPRRPDLIYEKTKLAGEQALVSFYRDTQYPISILRPVWVYGPGCPRTAKLFKAIGKRRFLIAGDGQSLRHCVYVSDLVEAFDLCSSSPAAVGQDFIIGDNSAVTIEGLVGEIASVLNVPPPRVKLPLAFVGPLCATTEALFKLCGKEPPLSRRSLKFFTNNTSFDISKARTLLKYSPRTTLKEGLRLTYRSLLQEGCVSVS